MMKNKYLLVYIVIVICFSTWVCDNSYSTDLYEEQKTRYTCIPAQGIYTYDYKVIWAKVHKIQDGSPGIIQFRMSKPDSFLTGGTAQVRMDSIYGPVWHEWYYEAGMYTTSPAFSLPLSFTSGTLDFFITVKNFETDIHSGKIQVTAEKIDSMPEIQWELPQENSVVFDPLKLKVIVSDKDLIQKVTLALLYKKTGAHKNITLYETKTPSRQTVIIEKDINISIYDEIQPGDIVAGIWSIDGDENVGYNNCICPLAARDIYLADSQLHIFSMTPSKLVAGKKQTVQIEGTGFTPDVTLSIESNTETIHITEINVVDSNTLYCAMPDSLNPTIYNMVISKESQFNRRFSLFSVIEAADKMKAIIVAASKISDYFSDPLWDAIKRCADYGYQSLLEKGYTHDEIIYLSPEIQSNVDNRATLTQLENALLKEIQEAEKILIYMVGHGKTTSFIINHYEELSATKLDEWLDNLQNNRLTREIIVVYDACHSGAFLPHLKPPESAKRYVITSASNNEEAFFINNGKLSFSFQFWADIRFGSYLDDAFFFGRDMVKAFQTSLLDANGNGIPNEKQDKEFSNRVVIGNEIEVKTYAPIVNNISDPQIIYDQTSANIWASGIIVENKVQKILAVVRPPEEPGINDPEFDIIELHDENNDHTYEAVYEKLDRPGKYIVSVYAVDSAGNHSEPVLTTITKRLSHEGDIYEKDNRFIQARYIDTPQTHNFHQADDIDWVYFYGTQGKEYLINATTSFNPFQITLYASDAQTVINEESGDNINIEFHCPENNFYFIQVNPLALSVTVNESQYQLSIQRKYFMDAYEIDDTYEQAKQIIINDFISQTHNFHEKRDEDWIQFYGIKNKTYIIEVESPGRRCDAVLGLYSIEKDLLSVIPPKDDGLKGEGELLVWNCKKSGIYYVKISSNDPEIFGEDTEYRFRIYYPITGMFMFQLQGLILGKDGMPMPNVHVETNIGQNKECKLTDETGRFHMILYPDNDPISTPIINISKEGYRTVTQKVNALSLEYIEIIETLSLRNDMNGDGIFGIDDAIHLLQFFSGRGQ